MIVECDPSLITPDPVSDKVDLQFSGCSFAVCNPFSRHPRWSLMTLYCHPTRVSYPKFHRVDKDVLAEG